MRAFVLALIALGFSTTALSNPISTSRDFRNVHGRYSIYANGDRLWTNGSKHLIEIVIPKLDKELQRRGWENSVAVANFRLCPQNMTNPLELTIRSQVEVLSYKNVNFLSH